jgi:hypothetical protein
VAVGDFNGDGVLDLAVANVTSNNVSVLLGTGDGTFQTPHVSYVVGSSPGSVAVGDFNGDGSPDLAAANIGSDSVSILLNDNTWPAGPRQPGGGRSRMIAGAATDGFAVEALSPIGSAPAALPALQQTLPEQERAPTLAAANEVRTEKPPPPATPSLPARPEGTPAQFLDGLFADPEGNWLWDRSADFQESVRRPGLRA